MKKAFTLVEMLVVIAIIGTLAAVLMGTFSGSTESAHTARCMSNMKNLASACLSASVAIGHIPPASSLELVNATVQSGGKAKLQYSEVKGWISWDSENKFKRDSKGYLPASHQSCSLISMYEESQSLRDYAITNGVLWKYLNGNHSTYICPHHERVKKAYKPNWSYIMNSYFGWDYSKGSKAIATDDGRGVLISATGMRNSDKYLLFAEVPFVEHDDVTPPDTTTGQECDSVLQYASDSGSIASKSGNVTSSGGSEQIGFNHKTGKQYFANVVFADGHTEKLVFPKTGMSESDIKDLTYWLCTGKDVSFNGKKYDKMTN